jgi:hypothetical protein
VLHQRHSVSAVDVDRPVGVTYRTLSKVVSAVVALCVVGAFPGRAQLTSDCPDPNEAQALAGAQQPPGQQKPQMATQHAPTGDRQPSGQQQPPTGTQRSPLRLRTPAWIFITSPC